jgi:hypothetical protein
MTHEDKIALISALHAWMQTQEVERQYWGALFATAAGVELGLICPVSNPMHKVGLQILNACMETAAS